jgi:hypothetical protein
MNVKFLMLAAVTIIAAQVFAQNAANSNDYKDDFSTSSMWLTWKSDKSVGMFSWNKDEGHDGKGSMEISVGKDCPADASFCFVKYFPAVSGKTYNAIVWVKAEDVTPSGEISLAFQGKDANKIFLGTPVLSSMILGAAIGEGWQRRVLTFTVPGDGAWSKTAFLICTLGIGKASQGKVYFDDFTFFETKY